jgi:hypothetical protein
MVSSTQRKGIIETDGGYDEIGKKNPGTDLHTKKLHKKLKWGQGKIKFSVMAMRLYQEKTYIVMFAKKRSRFNFTLTPFWVSV